MRKWNKFPDIVPEKPGDYLAVISNAQIAILHYNGVRWSSPHRKPWPEIFVTHWMNLPERPSNDEHVYLNR